MTERLYHGTSAVKLESIKKKGLLPRAKSRAKGNWTHTVNSNRNMIYLTDAYAWHFAVNASKTNGLILEINRDFLLPRYLCPDEDAIEQATRTQGPPEYPNFAPTDWSMERRTKHYRKIAPFNPSLADTSLKAMGTCAYYGGIPWKAITRYVIIDWKQLDHSLLWQAIDSQISVVNYRYLADRHKAFTRWFFGDEVGPEEITGYDLNKIFSENEAANGLKQDFEQRNNRVTEAMANRTGLQVVTVTHKSTEAEND